MNTGTAVNVGLALRGSGSESNLIQLTGKPCQARLSTLIWLYWVDFGRNTIKYPGFSGLLEKDVKVLNEAWGV